MLLHLLSRILLALGKNATANRCSLSLFSPLWSETFAPEYCSSILAITLFKLEFVEEYGSQFWGNGKCFSLHTKEYSFQPGAAFKLHVKFKTFHSWIEIVL